VREDREALETILGLLQKAGDTTHTSEILELLAHASVQQNDLTKARDLYLQLATMEPQNSLHARNYQQVVAKIGATGGSGQITSEEGALMVDELEAIAPFIDQHYGEEIISATRAALTDAELFVSYNMPEKALGPLAAALPAAPKHIKLNQRLASLYTRTGRFADAALCCRTLQTVYGEAGFGEESARYGELASKYEDRGALAAKAAAVDGPAGQHLAPPVPPAPSASASGFAEFAVMAPEAEAHGEDPREEEPAARVESHSPDALEAAAEGGDEIDLSEEWEDSAAEVSATDKADTSHEPVIHVSTEDAVAATVAEIHFYLQYGMAQQAHAGLAKLEGLTDDRAMLDALRAEVAQKAAQAAGTQSEAPQHEEPEAEEIVASNPEEVVELDASEPEAEIIPQVEPEPTPQPAAASAAPALTHSKLDDFVADLEAELPEDFMAPGESAIPPAYVIAPQASPAPQTAFLSAQPTQGASATAAQPALEAKPAAVAAPVAPRAVPPLVTPIVQVPASVAAAGADLNDMFDELRAGLEDESGPTHEDPEDHYNLGVAFREMGLVDEAIGELQKVCQSIDRGTPFKYTMQAYTWLAQCFLDKGVPEASIRWFEKALKLPNLDEEGRTALHYELASAYEAAQNKRAALAHFMEVYGANIDYRDVGERIHALKS
jgi:tetratricopeptide (TPR) repeat protein